MCCYVWYLPCSSDNPISDSDEAEVESKPHSDAGSGHADISNDEGNRPENGEGLLDHIKLKENTTSTLFKAFFDIFIEFEMLVSYTSYAND